ncbi:MAG: hypothetical protein IJU66_08025 [Oscillospiraceae bacterium]|nr:hypothetical protein [Oscillospiraceae bacterium]
MNKWRFLRRALAPVLLAAMLCGCAQQEKTAPDGSAPQQQDSPAAAVETQPEAEPAAAVRVENNGGDYVCVDGKVYFRRYGADAQPNTAVSGDFTGLWRAYDNESELMVYDPAAGTLSTLYAENGAGALWYGDGGFYLHEKLGGSSRVLWYALDGSLVQTLCPGEPLGVSEGGLLAVESYVPDSRETVYTLYRNKEVVAELSTDDFTYFAGLSDDGLFLLRAEYGEGAESTARLMQITLSGKLIELGTLPQTEYQDIYGMQVDRFLAVPGKVALGVGYYAGTGHFLNEYAFVEASAGEEGSLRALESEAETEDDELPRLTANGDGSFSLVPALPNELHIAYGGDNDGALELWNGGERRVLAPELCPQRSDGFGCQNIVQHMEYIDGTAYVTLARAHISPINFIGWRESYTLLGMRYLAIDGGGNVRELCATESGAELYGDVWFIEDAGTVLWRECAVSDEDGWDYCPEYAFAIPISENADRSGLGGLDPTAGLLDGDSVGDADYNGFSLPEIEPAGRFSLRMNQNGEIVSFSETAPTALLTISFDVPESALAGAVQKLDIRRRAFDEDTPWFWTTLRAPRDGVRVRVERTPDNGAAVAHLAGIYNSFAAGQTLCDVTLREGEFIALRASLPWHSEMRVSVSRDNLYGSYIFGEDNFMHFETEDSVHPDLTIVADEQRSLTATGYTNPFAMLSGAWLYRAPNGDFASVVVFDEDGSLSIEDDTDFSRLSAKTDHLFAGEYDLPDLLCLSAGDEDTAQRVGMTGSLGDYLFNLVRTDGQELLLLTQANNGDGALSALLPEAREKYSFALVRFRGVAEHTARLRGETFAAEAVRYDAENGLLWLQEAKIVDSYEDGSPVYRSAKNAPCIGYPIGSAGVSAELGGEYPLRCFSVTVDENGVITGLNAL